MNIIAAPKKSVKVRSPSPRLRILAFPACDDDGNPTLIVEFPFGDGRSVITDFPFDEFREAVRSLDAALTRAYGPVNPDRVRYSVKEEYGR